MRVRAVQKSYRKLKYLEGTELFELSKREDEKLGAMTDGKFAGMEFVAEE